MSLGLYVPEVARHRSGEARGFVSEPYCCVRERLGLLGPEARDLWWPIADRPSVRDDVAERLARDALPWFAVYDSRDNVLRACQRSERLGSAGAPSRIVAAIILAERGEHRAAQALLTQEVRDVALPSQIASVRDLADRLGAGPLGG